MALQKSRPANIDAQLSDVLSSGINVTPGAEPLPARPVLEGILSDAEKKEARRQFVKENYKVINIMVPNSERDAIKRYCEAHGVRIATMLRRAFNYVRDLEERGQITVTSSGILQNK